MEYSNITDVLKHNPKELIKKYTAPEKEFNTAERSSKNKNLLYGQLIRNKTFQKMIYVYAIKISAPTLLRKIGKGITDNLKGGVSNISKQFGRAFKQAGGVQEQGDDTKTIIEKETEGETQMEMGQQQEPTTPQDKATINRTKYMVGGPFGNLVKYWIMSKIRGDLETEKILQTAIDKIIRRSKLDSNLVYTAFGDPLNPKNSSKNWDSAKPYWLENNDKSDDGPKNDGDGIDPSNITEITEEKKQKKPKKQDKLDKPKIEWNGKTERLYVNARGKNQPKSVIRKDGTKVLYITFKERDDEKKKRKERYEDEKKKRKERYESVKKAPKNNNTEKKKESKNATKNESINNFAEQLTNKILNKHKLKG